MKTIFGAAWGGIRVACIVFVFLCMILGFMGGKEVFASGTQMALSCIAILVIGAGFGIASLIYLTELPTGLKVLIHMGTGIIIMLAVSIAVGWIDFKNGWKPCLMFALMQIAAAFIAWAVDWAQARRAAKRMNERIAEKE